MDMEKAKYLYRINNNMQPKIVINTNSKCAIVESQYSITKIKNNLKCSIQELRQKKKSAALIVISLYY